MGIFCKRHVDYNVRVVRMGSTIVHACDKSKQSACGRSLYKIDGFHPCNQPITCKSCLKVLAANDTSISVNKGTLYAILKDGLFVNKEGDLTSSLLNARTYKKRETAEETIQETVYVSKIDSNKILREHEVYKLLYSEIRRDYEQDRRAKPGFYVVPITLEYNGCD